MLVDEDRVAIGIDHQPMFEAWNGEPFAHGLEHFELRVQLAVVDAATPP